jgi:hypothetical protein
MTEKKNLPPHGTSVLMSDGTYVSLTPQMAELLNTMTERAAWPSLPSATQFDEIALNGKRFGDCTKEDLIAMATVYEVASQAADARAASLRKAAAESKTG